MSFEQMIDRAVTRENELLGLLRRERPIAETYIQDLEPDPDFGAVPRNDHYFLGRIDLSRGVTPESYIQHSKDTPGSHDFFGRLFGIRYLPGGFAQMMLIDGSLFDRAHYDFQFVRREFLGDVRTLVVSVNPHKDVGRGRFVGNIWIEDKGFHIVRFNGTYSGSSGGALYMHFDSWRVNAGPDMWLPYEIYSEESALSDTLKIHTLHFKALTRLWGYAGPAERARSEFTSLMIETGNVEDKSPQAADNSPVDRLRAWERQSEDNILDRLQKASLIARRGGVDQVLDTVVNNLVVTNNLELGDGVRTRALLTTPLESFTIGHTIVISRGLIDTLPDEASLAAVLAHELAHISLGHRTTTDFAFSDRAQFEDDRILERVRLARTANEEETANQRAMQLLMNSPYKEKLGQAGLFLKALSGEANHLPALIRPLFGGRMVENGGVLTMGALIARAPQLQTTRVDQIAALPLGSRTKLDPWIDDLEMSRMHVVPLTSPREKMPFELAPVYLHLAYQDSRQRQMAGGR